MDLTLYWFMLPVSILVATTAMFAGIGGAALFVPIFLIVFPFLGPEYVVGSAVAAVGVALLTETFGFSSGFISYYRKRLIDFSSGWQFVAIAVPVSVAGALLAQYVNGDLLKGAYALPMLVLAVVLFRHHSDAGLEDEEAGVANATSGEEMKRHIAADGAEYAYPRPRQGFGAIATSVGAFLTGMVGVGIGEVVMPQLAKRNRVPMALASGTSVFVVIVVVASASFTQISALISQGGLAAVPWSLVIYTIPGVVIGGQIGPRLHGLVQQRAMERTIAVLFVAIGLAMGWIVADGLIA